MDAQYIITDKYGETLETLKKVGESGKANVYGAIKTDGSSIDSPFYIVLEDQSAREVPMPVYSDDFYPQSEFAQLESQFRFFEDILELEEEDDLDEEPLTSLEENAGKGNPYRAKDGKFTTGIGTTKEQTAKVKELEETIRNNPKERFYAVNTKGETIATIDGNKDQVKIDFNVAMQVAASKNAVLTHNHPSQGHRGGKQLTYPFSMNDISAVSTMNAKTIRAVGTTHEYQITRGDSWPKPSELKRTHTIELKKADKALWEKVNAGSMTREDASFERHNIALGAMAKKFDLYYSRKEVK